MAVQIDEARRHQLAGGIEHAQRARLGNIRLDRLDQPKADADVALAAQRLAGIEHIAAFDKQVELSFGPIAACVPAIPAVTASERSKAESRGVTGMSSPQVCCGPIFAGCVMRALKRPRRPSGIASAGGYRFVRNPARARRKHAIFACRSALPVRSVIARSTGPATAMQVWPAGSP